VIDARGKDELRRAARELSEFTQVHALVGDVAEQRIGRRSWQPRASGSICS